MDEPATAEPAAAVLDTALEVAEDLALTAALASYNVRMDENMKSSSKEERVTKLSCRDRDLFLALLDNKSARPNKALRVAVKRYKKLVQPNAGVDD
jgi:hypothetical protein